MGLAMDYAMKLAKERAEKVWEEKLVRIYS